jgi:hypothetical protein
MISFFMQHIPPVYLLMEICTELPEGFVCLRNMQLAIPQMEFKMESATKVTGLAPVILICPKETPVTGARPYPPSNSCVIADTPARVFASFQLGKAVL